MSAGCPRVAYCRLSLAYMNDTTKVDDQDRICRELAHRRGWETRDELVWKMPLSTRRGLVVACYGVTVLPSSRRGPGFDPRSVRLTLACG